MVLLVREKSIIRNASEILNRDRIDVPLIAVSEVEPLSILSRQELQKRRIEWVPTMEVSGRTLCAAMSQKGFGVGLAFGTPGIPLLKDIRALPLKGFPLGTFGALWVGGLTPLGELFVEEAAGMAANLKEAVS